MTVERWDPSRHLEMLTRWMRARGLGPDAGPADMYPPTGAVADDCAIVFLYATDAPGVAYVDNLMTDPDASSDRRAAAVAAVLRAVSDDARARGVRLLSAVTRHGSVMAALEGLGFRRLDGNLSWFVRTEDE